jgi:hypothetical protein
MREVKVASAALGLILGVLAAVPASAWDRRDVPNSIMQVVLPALVNAAGGITAVRGPAEGLTVGPDNRIYAASNGAGDIANLFVFDASGNFYNGQNICAPPAVPCSVPIQGSTPDVLGIHFNPDNVNGLWVLDAGQILEINPATGIGVRLDIQFDPRNVLNGITFDGLGNAYVSDSGLGRIYQIPVTPAGMPRGPGTFIWSSGDFRGDPLLLPQNPRTAAPCAPPADNPPSPRCPNPDGITPAFGANGIEFSPPGCTPGVGGCALLVANTANRQILRIFCCAPPDPNNPMAPPKALPATVLINGVNGPDGIAVDPATNNIWVAANQSDEIVVIQPSTGPNVLPRVIAKLGDFNGLTATPDGGLRARGLLFPTSLAFSNLNPPPMFPPPAQRTLYVANSAFTGASAIDTEWGRAVTRYTVAFVPVPTITACPPPPAAPTNCGLFRP